MSTNNDNISSPTEDSGDDGAPHIPSNVELVSDSSAYTEQTDTSTGPTYGSRASKYLERVRGETSSEPADDVDPRQLHGKPTPNELRWYARWTPFAPTIVDKPVEDAFKHGYDVLNDPNGDAEDLLEAWEPYRQRARKAARQDGFAFVHVIYDDDNSAARTPRNVRDITGFNVLTLEQLATDFDDHNYYRFDERQGKIPPREIAPKTDYDDEQLRILPQGVVVVEDITSPDHHELVGAIYELSEYEPDDEKDKSWYRFIHADRLQHFVENPQVPSPLEERWVPEVTGHPTIAPVYPQLKNLSKTTWALGQAVYRYSSPLLVTEIETGVQPQGDDWEEHMNAINKQMEDVNTSSSATMPPGHSVDSVSTDSEMGASEKVETLVEMLCAGTEFTKTVLMGTQSGTVSGSESDIKNYFNQVQRYRKTTGETKATEILDVVRTQTPDSVFSNLTGEAELDWGPLFKIDELDTTEAMVRVTTAVTNAINNYLLTPEDAQSIMEAQWAELGVNTDLTPLDEDVYDELDRINVEKSEMTKGSEEPPDERGNPATGQNTATPPNQGSQSQSNPTTDAIVAHLSTDENYTSGDVVATPRGVGVVSGTLTEQVEDLPGGGSVDATDRDVYVVGFGGAFGLYGPEAVTGAESVTADAETDGTELYYHNGDVDPQNIDLPDGWDSNSLLEWWASVGGEWDEAKEKLAEQESISAQQAESIAATYKHAVLGTKEQIER